MDNQFCNSENKKKVFYVVCDNYKELSADGTPLPAAEAKKTIFIFLKRIISQNIYNYLKNFLENSDGDYDGKSEITENHKKMLYSRYINYFNNDKIIKSLKDIPLEDLLETFKEKINYLKIYDLKDKGNYNIKLIDDNIYHDDTNKTIINKISYYCLQNNVCYDNVFAWYNDNKNISYPFGFNYSKYPINSEIDIKFRNRFRSKKEFRKFLPTTRKYLLNKKKQK